MSFHIAFVSIVTVLVFNLNCLVVCHDRDKQYNRTTIFTFQDVKYCAKNEFYDLNYFRCVPCKMLGENLQPSVDKFSCSCSMSNLSPTVATIHDTVKAYRTCGNICNNTQRTKPTKNITLLSPQYCQTDQEMLPKLNCRYKYINRTRTSAAVDFSKSIEITNLNWQYDGLCDKCDLEYNFQYQGYCIANGLLRPYLNYNSFWQASSTQHFGNLKFVAFFCMALNNQTACNQLANLCILSFYSFDKNSPCSKFLLSQASDVVYRYGSADEQMAHLQIKPFLYYRKGKEIAKELREPIRDIRFSLDAKSEDNRLNFFTVSYALDGTLQRWGPLRFQDLLLCPFYKNSWILSENSIRFAQKYDKIECDLTLEHILDMARMFGNQRFMSIFLNYSNIDESHRMMLHTIPILIEDITLENKRPQKEDWQLVKRFQMIETHRSHGSITSKISAIYEDAHKLLLYRSLRYVEKLELHYDIHDDNRISIPILKLRYRHIEFTNNTTLDMPLKFQFIISNRRIEKGAGGSNGELANEIILPILLLLAVVAALIRARNIRKRQYLAPNNEDFCHFAYFTEFLLHLISYMALVFLLCYLLCVIINSLTYLNQTTVELTVPIVKDQRSLEVIVYAALVLKLIFVAIYFWRLSHFNIFFIDWERPRCGDTNHFNLKNNLETSSVCSSVRTYISETNVSAWRSIFLANEWLHLSGKQKTSTLVQGIATYTIVKISNLINHSQDDITLEIFYITLIYSGVYILQYFLKPMILPHIFGNSLQKFTEHCSLANISVFVLKEPSYGYYIHGRSPHGFADSDMTTMIMQLQRETQSLCGRRGLLSDTDQCYIIMPPKNLNNYFDKLLLPYQRSFTANTGVGGNSTNYPKELNTIEGSLEKTSIAFSSVNRFFCAFIDHGIKDMDYIIKEKTFVESLFNCELDNYLTDQKGTFYIDKNLSFSQMFLYGNELQIFVVQFLLFLAVYLMFHSVLAAAIVIYSFNKILQMIFVSFVKENVSVKTLIDKRFLM
ncbi:meckelin [Musca domestica]|uniref:Meckelin isoform X1 n=1 Tax=Musca domestica TaxID=7370 RepID=A0A1I8MJR4_MUSDO|nr:meckelin [Musca domestica]